MGLNLKIKKKNKQTGYMALLSLCHKKCKRFERRVSVRDENGIIFFVNISKSVMFSAKVILYKIELN